MTTAERRAGRAMTSATRLLVSEFGDVLWAVYQAVDEMQRRSVDTALDLVTLEAFTPAWISATVTTAADQWADSTRVFGSSRALQLGYREFVNKLEVFNLVKHARRFMGSDVADERSVPRLIDVAYSLPPFLRVWAIEGLGHDYADWARRNGTPLRLLRAEGVLPDAALPMLHAGFGLSVADEVLRRLTPFDDEAAGGAAVDEFCRQCDRDSRRGYTGCAYESLGLVTRTLYLPLMHSLHRALASERPTLLPYFWHGIGRGLYFSPLQFVPGVSSPWARIDAEAPDARAQSNATAGLAWATALVNMRHPEIVAAVLPGVSERLRARGAVAEGVASALAMALETDPSNPFLPRFCAYAPAAAASRQVWSATVPPIEAVDRIRREALEPPGLEVLFRYRGAGEPMHGGTW